MLAGRRAECGFQALKSLVRPEFHDRMVAETLHPLLHEGRPRSLEHILRNEQVGPPNRPLDQSGAISAFDGESASVTPEGTAHITIRSTCAARGRAFKVETAALECRPDTG